MAHLCGRLVLQQQDSLAQPLPVGQQRVLVGVRVVVVASALLSVLVFLSLCLLFLLLGLLLAASLQQVRASEMISNIGF